MTFPFAARSVSIMVLSAVGLHLCWAIIILFDESAVNATAVNALFRYIDPPRLLAGSVAAAAFLALYAMLAPGTWTLLLLLPQQVLLMMSAAGAVEAIWASQFADGAIRPHGFIAADQIYSIIVAIGHTAAIIMQARRRVS